MKHEIYRVLEPTEFYDTTTGEPVPFLTYESPRMFPDGALLSTGVADATLEELVELCDHDAENRNAHDFCGVHRLLGAVLFRRYGRESATATMAEIALLGGLQGMAGVCSEGDAYEELNVGQI